ncbi:MAG: putative quinol monooxygenase [Anaerolineales bacterium]
MAMIIIAGMVQVLPEKRDAARAAAREMSVAPEQEPGCQVYRISEDTREPNTFRIFELWDDNAALQTHFQTPHMATFNGILPTVLAGEPQAKRYDVHSVEYL